MSRRLRGLLLLPTLVGVAMSPWSVSAQASTANMAPTNNLPNPYRTIDGWAKMPDGRTWGSTSAVEIDRDGKSVWVAERCGTNACAGSTLDPILLFDSTGTLVRHFGSGMILSPHAITVDRDGNVWVVDCACTVGGGRRGGAAPAAPDGPPKGHQIFKFSPDGKLLMTLGNAGGGRSSDYFFQPNDILVTPAGDVFVSEGHSTGPGLTSRIYKFSKDGKLLATWGDTVRHDAEGWDQPHALAMDSKGRLFVGDRGNNRIKILDPNTGKVLDTWYQFSRPSGIFIDAQDNIYVADSESQSVGSGRGREWKRGIRVGSAKDGSVKFFIPDPVINCAAGQQPAPDAPCANNTSSAEGIAVDPHGVIYGAQVQGPPGLKRYVKN